EGRTLDGPWCSPFRRGDDDRGMAQFRSRWGHARLMVFGYRSCVWILYRRAVQWRDRRRILSHSRVAGLVPVRLSDGGGARNPAAIRFAIPDYHERRPVYLLRQLQYVLRDGHRRTELCAAWRRYPPGLVRRL